MPIVRVELLEGRSPETKAALIRRLTEAIVDTLGAQPSQVRVLLHDVPPENWGVGGQTMQELRQASIEPTE
jgi:4-oxalocrotonate tautomerase